MEMEGLCVLTRFASQVISASFGAVFREMWACFRPCCLDAAILCLQFVSFDTKRFWRLYAEHSHCEPFLLVFLRVPWVFSRWGSYWLPAWSSYVVGQMPWSGRPFCRTIPSAWVYQVLWDALSAEVYCCPPRGRLPGYTSKYDGWLECTRVRGFDFILAGYRCFSSSEGILS